MFHFVYNGISFFFFGGGGGDGGGILSISVSVIIYV
jgi:hypothetical protein